jgi:hypothetical protein
VFVQLLRAAFAQLAEFLRFEQIGVQGEPVAEVVKHGAQNDLAIAGR